VCVCVCVALLFLPLVLSGCDAAARPAAQGTQARNPIVAEPGRIDLGTVAQGSKHTKTIVLRNTTSRVVEIARRESSCACLELALPKRRWEPGEAVEAKLIVDLAREPEFTGALGLSIKGWTAEGRVGFAVECLTTVSH
jgi:hypothetical protein